MAFALESPAFRNGERIPDKCARDGLNLSPPFVRKGAPQGTKSFMLVVEDPDAPSVLFRHVGVYDIGAERDRLLEGTIAGSKAREDRGHVRSGTAACDRAAELVGTYERN